jgi:uncharacterized membrane protein
MSGKNIAIVAYLTALGWLIAIISFNNNSVKESLAAFHIRQSLGLMLTGLVLASVPHFMGLGFLANIAALLVFVLWIIGFISAVQGQEKEVPLVGKYYQDWFKGIV